MTEPTTQTYYERRVSHGEAYMWCNECGAKLHSFDGNKDADRSCPYKRGGKCEPPIQGR